MSPHNSSKDVAKGSLRWILIVENSHRPGIGLFIETLFKSEKELKLDSLVVDTDEVTKSLSKYKSDVVILEVEPSPPDTNHRVLAAMRYRRPAPSTIIFSWNYGWSSNHWRNWRPRPYRSIRWPGRALGI